ncbi:MAG TPA: hypothetical protein VK446_00605 [Methylocystis sp.]|nr:hypothetical protein [Methylocystis sp.]
MLRLSIICCCAFVLAPSIGSAQEICGAGSEAERLRCYADEVAKLRKQLDKTTDSKAQVSSETHLDPKFQEQADKLQKAVDGLTKKLDDYIRLNNEDKKDYIRLGTPYNISSYSTAEYCLRATVPGPEAGAGQSPSAGLGACEERWPRGSLTGATSLWHFVPHNPPK